MKRNNIFMWAYITFIGICIIARIIGDFPLWQPIVLAITISSAFFAFEDLYSSRSRYLRDSCSIAENFIAEAKKRNNDHLLFFAKLSEASKRYKGTANDVGTIEDAFGPVKEQTEALSGYIKELEAKTTAKQKKQVEYHRIASIFAFLGFLCLFCTMAFAPHMDLANVQQEGLSVFSFAVILLTQQLNISYEAKISRENHDSKEALQIQALAGEALNISKERLDYLVSLIEGIDSEMEATTSAD